MKRFEEYEGMEYYEGYKINPQVVEALCQCELAIYTDGKIYVVVGDGPYPHIETKDVEEAYEYILEYVKED